jgi:hypothetical protein
METTVDTFLTWLRDDPSPELERVPPQDDHPVPERVGEAAPPSPMGNDLVLTAITSVPKIDLTALYQELGEMPLAELRSALARLVASGRVESANEPLPGLPKHTVYWVRDEPETGAAP